MFLGIHDFRSFMKTSKEQRTFLTRFCWRSIESIEIRPGTTLATSFNAEKTLGLYDFWDIEFKSKAYFYRQVRRIRTIITAPLTFNRGIIFFLILLDSKYGGNNACSWKWKNNNT